MPDFLTPDPAAAFERHAPHLYAMMTDDGLRAQLRQIEDQEAIVHAKNDLATAAGLDAAEHPLDVEKFTHALRVAREESAATIELQTLIMTYITGVLAVVQRSAATVAAA